MKTSKINDFEVVPIKIDKFNPANVRGKELFPDPYCNISIIGSKNHGKTTIVYNILEKVCYKNNVIIFSPTVHNDVSYKAMIKMLEEKKKCSVIAFDHFIDSATGENRIQELIDLLTEKEEEKKEEEKKEEEPQIPIIKFKNGFETDKKEEKEVPKDGSRGPSKKSKLITAEYVCVFDDLGADLRNPSIYQFLIKNRHFKTKNIICLHNSVNLTPGSWNNLDFAIFLSNIPEDAFLTIQDKLQVTYKGENKHNPILYEAYKYATSKPYNFLYLNRNTRELRRNFNEKIEVE